MKRHPRELPSPQAADSCPVVCVSLSRTCCEHHPILLWPVFCVCCVWVLHCPVLLPSPKLHIQSAVGPCSDTPQNPPVICPRAKSLLNTAPIFYTIIFFVSHVVRCKLISFSHVLHQTVMAQCLGDCRLLSDNATHKCFQLHMAMHLQPTGDTETHTVFV